MIKILKKNKIFIIFYFLLFIAVFYPQFFLRKIDNKIKFGKIGTNFFFRKYSNHPELRFYLDQIYEDYKILPTKVLCRKLSHETYKIKQPIKKILNERNVNNCTDL